MNTDIRKAAGIAISLVCFAFVAVKASTCYSDDCGDCLEEGQDTVCVPCEGGICQPPGDINNPDNTVSASIVESDGHREIVREAEPGEGYMSQQVVTGDCRWKVSYVCDGQPNTEWISGPKDVIPAGAQCSPQG